MQLLLQTSVATLSLALVTSVSPLAAQGFVDRTATAGIANIPLSTGGDGAGFCCADFDGDGDLDVIVPGTFGAPIQYFRNDGGMSFTDLTPTVLLGLGSSTRAVLAADVDNDGDQDFLIANWRNPLQLFINQGNGVFHDEGCSRGLMSITSVHGASFGDYDRDGWLDLYLANRVDAATSSGEPNTLYRGIGDGHFVDVTQATGTGNNGLTYAAPFCDYDEDGWPDIVIANDKGALGVPNDVLRNMADGTFGYVGALINAAQVMDGMGCDFVDAFNDGGVDIYISDSPVAHLFLHWNPVTGQYVDDSFRYGITGIGVGWAVNWLDYDNDGWQDISIVHNGVPNSLYRNPGTPAAANTTWTDNGFTLGLGAFMSQYTNLVADLDNDGRIDVLNRFAFNPLFPSIPGITVHHNQVSAGNWLKIVPRGTVSNRDGIGARIEVQTGTLTQRQYRRNGTGYLSGSDPRVHFGLGAATQADHVTIIWPSGQIQHLDNVAANQILEVVEPSFVMTAPMTVGGTTSLELEIQGDAGLLYGMVLSFNASPQSQLPDGRFVPLNLDALSSYSVIPGNQFLSNPLNFLDVNGRATSSLSMPNNPLLTGLTLWATAATIEPQGFPFVRTLFPQPVEILIQ